MKISKRLKEYISLGARMISSLVSLMAVGFEFGEHGPDILDFVRRTVSSGLDYFSPGISVNDLILDILVWFLFFVGFTLCWLVLFLVIRRMVGRFLNGLITLLILEMSGPVKEQSRKANEEMLLEFMKEYTEKLEKMRPPPPLHAVTEELCPRSGLYSTQGDVDMQLTFREGQILPPVYVKGLKRDVTWVYQPPQ